MSFTQKMPLLNMVESGSIDQFVLKIAMQAQLTQILLCCPEEIKEFGMTRFLSHHFLYLEIIEEFHDLSIILKHELIPQL